MVAFIPGFLVGWGTFPGVVAHELAHFLTCRWRQIAVRDVTWFSLRGRGNVRHARPRNHIDLIFISFAPFIFNSLLAAVCYAVAIGIYVYKPPLPANWVLFSLLFLWLGFSIGMHAFPSRGDAKNVWRAARRKSTSSVLALLSLPIAALTYVVNLLEMFWLDAVYAAALAIVCYSVLALTTFPQLA